MNQALVQGNLGYVPKPGKYFCKLCRKSGIKERKAHLVLYHKVDKKAMDRPSSDSIVKEVFVESVQ